MVGRSRAAGASTQRKYDELVRSWRRCNRKLFTVVGLVCASMVAVSVAVAPHLSPSYAWVCGVVAGCALAFFVLLRVSPPGWIENWQSGAWGEVATGKALRRAEFPQRVVEKRCTYVHGDELADWLRSRPRTVAPRRVRQVADAVRRAWDAEPA